MPVKKRKVTKRIIANLFLREAPKGTSRRFKRKSKTK